MPSDRELESPPQAEESDSGSDSPEPGPIALSQIKTLRELYHDAVLEPVQDPKNQHVDDFLDKVSLFQGDITNLQIDSIVNAANRSLLGGGGVDGAIHAAAGPELLEECRTLDGCETGFSKITKGYDLPAKHIIHTVGPVYSSSHADVKAEQLTSCYKTSLELAVAHELKHIAFCSISTGIYGYPIEDATHIALQVVRSFCESQYITKVDRVIFVVWSNKDRDVYRDLIPLYFPPPPQSADEPAE